MWTITIKKLGFNDYGKWALVDLFDDILTLSCVVSFDKDYELVEKSSYSVKKIDIKTGKNGKLIYKIGL